MTIDNGRQVIVPKARFNCNGRITNVAVSIRDRLLGANNFPLFQVWHPTSFNSSTYNKTGEVQLLDGGLKVVDEGSYYHVNMPLNSNSQIEFQSGDVIGYYQPSSPRQKIWNVQTSGYTSYSNIVTSPSTLIDINNVDNNHDNYQPLIAVMFGKVKQYYDIAKSVHVCLANYEMYNKLTRCCGDVGKF